MIGKFKNECPKIIWIDEFVCLRSKAYLFKFKDNNENKNKIKGISKSQSKHIKFEEHYNCLFGKEYQKECDNFIIPSLTHDMYLQKLRKSTLSIFDVILMKLKVYHGIKNHIFIEKVFLFQ